MKRLRVGIVDYLNSRPLAWGLARDRHRSGFEIGFHPPARLADLMAVGELDIGLLPSIEVQRIPGLSLLPGLCIAATHEVQSVLLVSKVPVEQIGRVSLDCNSRTSAALVRILLADRFGLAPEWRVAPPKLEQMLDGSDAALLIGDPALRVDRRQYRVLDLAAEWRGLTGLPFVFAVWAVREAVSPESVDGVFEDSLQRGLERIPELAREAAEELRLDEEMVRAYLSRNLRFTLGPEEIDGLQEFYRRARVHGLLGAPLPIRFFGCQGRRLGSAGGVGGK